MKNIQFTKRREWGNETANENNVTRGLSIILIGRGETLATFCLMSLSSSSASSLQWTEDKKKKQKPLVTLTSPTPQIPPQCPIVCKTQYGTIYNSQAGCRPQNATLYAIVWRNFIALYAHSSQPVIIHHPPYQHLNHHHHGHQSPGNIFPFIQSFIAATSHGIAYREAVTLRWHGLLSFVLVVDVVVVIFLLKKDRDLICLWNAIPHSIWYDFIWLDWIIKLFSLLAFIGVEFESARKEVDI